MNGGPVTTESPAVVRPVMRVETSKASEAQKPPAQVESRQKNGDRTFKEEAKNKVGETISGKISRGEALASMIGHIVTAGTFRDIEAVHKTLEVMLKDKKVPKDTQDFLVERMRILDSVIKTVEKAECGLDVSMTNNARLALGEDIDIHVLKRQLKISGSEMPRNEVDKIKEEIVSKEKIRRELKNENGTEIKDQVEEFAVMLAGGDRAKLQEDPIGYIGKFFTEELPKEMATPLGQKLLAERMGLTQEQLKSVVVTFTTMQEYQDMFAEVHEITSDYEVRHSPAGKLKEAKKKGLMLLNISTAISAVLAWQSLKGLKEEQR